MDNFVSVPADFAYVCGKITVMPRFQFTLRELFLAVTLIGVGVGGTVLALNPDDVGIGRWSLVVLFLSPGLIGTGAATLIHKKTVGTVTGLVVGLVLAVIDLIGVGWVGNTNLEVQFVIAASDSGQPVPDARVEVQSEGGFYAEPKPQKFVLTADADGIARKECLESMCCGTKSGLHLIHSYSVRLPWWRYRIVATGFKPSPWTELEVAENGRQVRRMGPGHAQLVVRVSLLKESGVSEPKVEPLQNNNQ